MTPQTAEHREWRSFEIPEMTTDTAKIVMRWEKIAVPFTVDTKSTERTMTSLRNAMSPDWRTPYMAADFAFNNKGAATDAEMTQWVEQSLKVNQNIANLWLRARMADRAGNRADAVRYGEMAIAAATPQQADFASEVRRTVDRWKAR
jgi:Tfp pilus assembly protein PilF